MKTFNESFLTSKRLPVILEKTINVDWTKGTNVVRNEVLNYGYFRNNIGSN